MVSSSELFPIPARPQIASTRRRENACAHHARALAAQQRRWRVPRQDGDRIEHQALRMMLGLIPCAMTSDQRKSLQYVDVRATERLASYDRRPGSTSKVTGCNSL